MCIIVISGECCVSYLFLGHELLFIELIITIIHRFLAAELCTWCFLFKLFLNFVILKAKFFAWTTFVFNVVVIYFCDVTVPSNFLLIILALMFL